ncbi:MAG: hypothetical protein ABR597_14245 [Bacteroidales bacterium]
MPGFIFSPRMHGFFKVKIEIKVEKKMTTFSSPEHPSMLVGKGRGWVMNMPQMHGFGLG